MWPSRSTSESETLAIKCSYCVHVGGVRFFLVVVGFFTTSQNHNDLDWMLISHEGAPALAVLMFSCLHDQTESCRHTPTCDVNHKYESGCDQENHNKCILPGQTEIFM